MYHPASGNLLESYVELRNLDNIATNISGWRFTKGIQFTFPTNTVLGPSAYLVVAADRTAFTNKYPGVANFTAGWSGTIGHHLKLESADANTISELQFADDGDWSTRVLTTNGLASYGHNSWEWSAPQDGGGSSLELINPAMPISFAQNWGPSSTLNGTPGGPNSLARTNAAPFITDVAHSPIIPKSTDVVTVSARITDEHTSGQTVTIFYRDATTATPPAFTSAPMFDDGAHGDGLAADGIYAAILPAHPAGTIIEFYIQATDLESNLRTYPNVLPPTNSLRTANMLYQVDEGAYAGSQPVYRLIMTEMERAELNTIGGPNCPDYDSDAQMNATWITTDGVSTGGTATQFRYNVGVRNRGHGTRHSRPNNYHVNIPGDRTWKGVVGINLNSQYTFSQNLGSAVFRRLEVPMPESRAVQVRVNSTNIMSLSGLSDNNSFGSYAANEQYNNDFIQRAFPLDPNGDSYRGIRQAALCDPLFSTNVADLVWHGSNYAQEIYTNSYFKQNNFISNDWSDLIDLIAVLNSANGYSPANYVNDIQTHINVEEWMKYMAINTLLDNDETCLANGVGDDYALYRGSNDLRWLALPYDLDTLMGRGLTSVPPMHNIWRMTAIPTMNTFMKRPEFAPIYFKWLKTYCDTLFSAEQMNPLLDQLMNSFVPQLTIDTMKAFNTAQVSNVLAQIPLALTVSNSLPLQSGFPRTTTPSVTLFGTANAIDTRTVLVNGSAAAWTAWQARWTNTLSLSPGINRIFVQALNSNGVEIASTYIDIWYDRGAVTTVGGTIAANTLWTAAGGPYNVTSSLTINSGVTLTIQPGTTVYLGSGINLTVANGGTLLAEGTLAAPIRFTVTPGSGVNWGGLTINGAVGSPETRIAYAFFDGNANTCIEVAGGTLYLDHSSFGTTTHQYVSLDNSSFLISSCIFPTTTAAFEPLHGTGGIKSGGRGIVRDCFFGTTSGSMDIMDFTGGNRDLGQPIVQYYNNVFTGATDDMLDLDGTDAWIEGNIFMHSHLGPVHTVAGTSSAISGGDNGTDTSQITIINNIFYDCDNVAQGKQGNFYTLLNNTIVHQNHLAGNDTDGAVIATADENESEAVGMYLEGNIIYDAEKLVRNHTNSIVTFSNNLMPFVWAGPGGGNSTNAPLLKYIPQVSETAFTTWQQAQVLRDWFSLLPGSPAFRSGPNGRDKGGVNPIGASISGEPIGTNNQTTASLRVGIVRTGNSIPVSGWPNGSGYTHYKWRLDNGAWSVETPIATPINLSSLANGPHRVDVTGKRDSGFYQDDPAFGLDALVTTGRTWTVNTSYTPPITPTVRLNEILAQNSTTLTNGGSTPDLLELYNYGTSSVDLSGMGLTDNALLPYKYTFPNGTPLLGPGQFLVLYADSATNAGIHLGFGIKASGDDVYLTDKPANGGLLVDSVGFGVQVPDFSIGRAIDGSWQLCRPTFGSANVILPLGAPATLRINEWLADELFLANNDFFELFNPQTLPVDLSGLFLSNAEGAPTLNPIPRLSFIGGNGFVAFTADGDTTQGADHVNFKLNANAGIIMFSDPSLNIIDEITYGPQVTDVAQGRTPDGSSTIASFLQPTPGGPNPIPNTSFITNVTTQTFKLLTTATSWRWNNSGGTNLSASWNTPGFDDSTWSSGLPLFGYETTPAEYAPYTFQTYIQPPDTNGGHITVYYRTHFTWTGGVSNFTLWATNYIDDGAAFYLNGTKVGAVRMPATYTYDTVAAAQPTEGVPDILNFPAGSLVTGDNVLAAEVHQINTTSSDDVFGCFLSAIAYSTNLVATTNSIPVVLNEVLASNHSLTNANGLTSDWVELFNPSTNALDLTDLSLSNDPNTPRKFVFPSGTLIPAGGSLVVYCDNTLPASPTNTGFTLDATGGSVLLFTSLARGGGLIDAISYGLQTADYSLGRIPNGLGTWSLSVPTPGAANTAAALGSVSAFSVNEWMADDPNGPDWFELFNSGPQPVALGGLFFTDDLTKKTMSPVPPLSFIGLGQNAYIQFVADNPANPPANHVRFKLSKSGDTIGLYSPAGLLITALTFGAQQTGVSQGRFPDGSANVVSFTTTVSPGESNFLPPTNAVVNEILTHTDPPLEDAIEIYNPSALSANIGGWFLSNSQDDFKKFRIADGTIVPAHGFKVFYEYQFNPTNGSSVPFTFNSAHGDNAYLSEADSGGNLTGYRASASFGAAAHGVSFGCYTNSIGAVNYVATSAHTFGVDNPSTVDQFRLGTGAPNAYPLVGPVVINEIMFNPPSLDGTEDNVQDEYIELMNLTPYPVPLFDPAAPTNTWQIKGGVDYTFPQNVTLDAAGFLLLVNFDPASDLGTLAEFRGRYHLSNSIPLYGPYSGHLANSGENIALYKPDPPQLPPHPDAGFVPSVLVEEINYSSTVPWPSGAAGTGSSLQRQTASNFGDDPINWFVAAPTAGLLNTTNAFDADGDGLPDAWEIQYFGSINDPRATPNADPDGDGFTNLQEYYAGTDPLDPNSSLKINSVNVSAGSAAIHFNAIAGRTYSILYRGDLQSGTWLKLVDIPAQGSTGVITINDPTIGSAPRFYRLATPKLP